MTDVTVLTPSLAYGRFVEDSIQSVLGQKGLVVQHVVQDGGSKDETLDVLRRYDHAVDWRSEPDTGQSDALNRALSRAEGKWIAWLNADEFYLPGGLAALVDEGERSSADVIYGDNVWVDEDGRIVRLVPEHPFSHLTLKLFGNYIPSSSALFRRSTLGPKPWDPDARMMMDWDLYLKLAAAGADFRHIKYPVGAFRRHGEQVTALPSSHFRDEYERIFRRYSIKGSRRRWGPWLHRVDKAANGAYWRQFRARHLHGADLCWFRNDADFGTFDRLLDRCYGRGAMRRVGSTSV